MSDQSVYFNTGLDTDERAATTAIQPIVAGERVQAAVVDRPLEILRARTETLREQTEEQKFLQDSDMRWIITGGDPVGVASGNAMPRVTWNKGTGKFTIIGGDNDVVPCMILQPIQGPNTDKKGTHTYVFTGALSGNVIASTTYFAYEGGARHKVVWAHAAAAGLGVNKCSVTFTGTPVHTMTITVATEGTTQLIDLSAQLTAVGMPLNGFSVSFTGDMAALLDFTQIPSGDVTVTLTGTYDRELHYITKAQIDQFFITEGETIASGDTLGIYYPFMVDPNNPTTRGGRRQATPTSAPGGGGANTAVTAAQLFLASAEPEKIAQSIPICKRIGDDLIFIDGTVVRGDEPTTPTGTVYFGSNGYTIQGFGDTTPYADAGAFKIGVADKAAGTAASADKFTITAGMLQTVLEALQTFVNDKASLDTNEDLTGDWLQTTSSAWYIGEASGTNVCRLIWRTGVGRPADGSVGWTTISRYQLNDHGVSTYESMFVTVTGGYLLYNSGWKVKSPATGGPGNITVDIEVSGCWNIAEHNVRGSYRIYNAALATEYDLLPADVLSSGYTSGFSARDSDYALWGTDGLFTAAFGNITLTADHRLEIGATTIQIDPISDTSSMATHSQPQYYAPTFYGASLYGYTNRVLDGFTVVPATTAGRFAADTITLTAGRAFVAGKLIEIKSSTTLTSVSTAHGTSGFSCPATQTVKWYGIWLRSDGSFRVGNLPDMGLHSGVLGSTRYMIPLADVEGSYSRHSYTLVDIVWCYDYDGTPNHIRYAGMNHLGGNLYVYQQARYGTYASTPVWGNFVMHTCAYLEASETNVDEIIVAPTNNYAVIFVGAIPGIPTNISGAALLSAYVDDRAITATAHVHASILHTNDTLVVDATESTSKIAPPIAVDTADIASSVYQVNHSSTYYYSFPIWLYENTRHTGSAAAMRHANTVIYPLQRIAADSIGNITYNFKTEGLTTGDFASFRVTNLGFFWDRYNPGGIY